MPTRINSILFALLGCLISPALCRGGFSMDAQGDFINIKYINDLSEPRLIKTGLHNCVTVTRKNQSNMVFDWKDSDNSDTGVGSVFTSNSHVTFPGEIVSMKFRKADGYIIDNKGDVCLLSELKNERLELSAKDIEFDELKKEGVTGKAHARPLPLSKKDIQLGIGFKIAYSGIKTSRLNGEGPFRFFVVDGAGKETPLIHHSDILCYEARKCAMLVSPVRFRTVDYSAAVKGKLTPLDEFINEQSQKKCNIIIRLNPDCVNGDASKVFEFTAMAHIKQEASE